MEIRIENIPVVMKENESFDYICENSLFTGADEYTMEISLPLKGCSQNIEIFGRLFRADVSPRNLIFDCEIRDKNFHKTGCVTITEINESEVKVQFLADRSEQNFNTTFDDIYINELSLGNPEITSASEISPDDAMNPERNGYEAVCLPWVIGSSSNGDVYNKMIQDKNSQTIKYEWDSEVVNLTWQPYLIWIAKRICEAVDYEYDFDVWENDKTRKYFIICNSLPDSWQINGYARILPHWTVAEFFEKLESFLGGEFNVNHKTKKISFNMIKSVDEKIEPVRIENIVDEFSAEITYEDSNCDYIENRNFKYKSQSDNMWNFYSCKWYIDLIKSNPENSFTQYLEFDTLEQLIAATKKYQSWNGFADSRPNKVNSLFYVKEFDMHYILRYHERIDLGEDYLGLHHWNFSCFLQPVNSFGDFIASEKYDAEDVELDFIPVCIDYVSRECGVCMFLYPGTYSEDNEELDESDLNNGYRDNDFWPEMNPEQTILRGEKESIAEYYSNIYIGFWDGEKRLFYNSAGLLLPHPLVENVNIDSFWNYEVSNFSMRLNNGSIKERFRGISLNVERKYNFDFISDTIPNPRAVFYIRGKKYLCEKLTCTFNDRGRSKLIKGEFWSIKE